MKRLPRKNAVYTPDSATTILINYQKEKQILEVEYTGGSVYHYYRVPPEIWNEYVEIIKAGRSSGTYVNQQIKPRFGDYEEV